MWRGHYQSQSILVILTQTFHITRLVFISLSGPTLVDVSIFPAPSDHHCLSCIKLGASLYSWIVQYTLESTLYMWFRSCWSWNLTQFLQVTGVEKLCVSVTIVQRAVSFVTFCDTVSQPIYLMNSLITSPWPLGRYCYMTIRMIITSWPLGWYCFMTIKMILLHDHLDDIASWPFWLYCFMTILMILLHDH